jgi:hypothetical protein
MMLLQLVAGTKSAGKSLGFRFSRGMFAGSSGIFSNKNRFSEKYKWNFEKIF